MSESGSGEQPAQQGLDIRWGSGGTGRWTASALLIFALAHVFFFGDLLTSDFSQKVMATSWGVVPGHESRAGALPTAGSLQHTDHRFVVWLTARNSRALLESPSTFFEAEPCFPAPKSLAFGESGLTLGLVGLPVWLLTGDPVATFNWVVLCLIFFAGLSMYLLVVEWTGVAPAGIVAGLLYAYGELRIGDLTHINVYDNAWTVLALYFATRLFRSRRWADALGLTACIVLQLGSSLYTVVGAVIIALPALFWLVRSVGPVEAPAQLRHRLPPPAQLGFIILVAIAASIFIFGPYLEASKMTELPARSYQVFNPLTFLTPGYHFFLGWTTWALVLPGIFMSSKLKLRSGLADPRFALLAGMALAMLLSVGAISGESFAIVGGEEARFVPYRLAARVIPGLDVVRAPAAIIIAYQLLACILVGLGVAGLMRRLDERSARWLFGVILLCGCIELARPDLIGMEPRISYGTVQMRPADDDIALLQSLVEEGRTGPLLELPMVPKDLVGGSLRLLLSAYHHRRTSACYNPSRYDAELVEVSRRLPGPQALSVMREAGFTDVVLHHERDILALRRLREGFAAAAAEGSATGIEKLGETRNITVYRIEPRMEP